MNFMTYNDFLRELSINPQDYKKTHPRDYVKGLMEWEREERYLINEKLREA